MKDSKEIFSLLDNGRKYLFKGKYETVSYDTIKITELPIGTQLHIKHF